MTFWDLEEVRYPVAVGIRSANAQCSLLNLFLTRWRTRAISEVGSVIWTYQARCVLSVATGSEETGAGNLFVLKQ